MSSFQPGCAAQPSDRKPVSQSRNCPEINRTKEISPWRLKTGQRLAGTPGVQLSERAINEGQIEYTDMP
jgi:hypothetical protein